MKTLACGTFDDTLANTYSFSNFGFGEPVLVVDGFRIPFTNIGNNNIHQLMITISGFGGSDNVIWDFYYDPDPPESVDLTPPAGIVIIIGDNQRWHVKVEEIYPDAGGVVFQRT